LRPGKEGHHPIDPPGELYFAENIFHSKDRVNPSIPRHKCPGFAFDAISAQRCDVERVNKKETDMKKKISQANFMVLKKGKIK